MHIWSRIFLNVLENWSALKNSIKIRIFVYDQQSPTLKIETVKSLVLFFCYMTWFYSTLQIHSCRIWVLSSLNCNYHLNYTPKSTLDTKAILKPFTNCCFYSNSRSSRWSRIKYFKSIKEQWLFRKCSSTLEYMIFCTGWLKKNSAWIWIVA